MIKENFYLIAKEEIVPITYSYNPDNNSVVEAKIDFDCLNVFGHTATVINDNCVIILFGIYSDTANINDRNAVQNIMHQISSQQRFTKTTKICLDLFSPLHNFSNKQLVYNLENNSLAELYNKSNIIPSERVFHSVAVLKSNYLLMYGGIGKGNFFNF